MMSVLTDRQRIELALPAYLLFALSRLPSVFAPADPALAERAEADIAALCEDLRIACLERSLIWRRASSRRSCAG